MLWKIKAFLLRMRCYRAASRQRKCAFVSHCLDDLALEDPRCPLADLATRKDAGTDRAQDRHLALCENRGRLLETQLAACRSFAVTVNCDLVLIAEGPDLGPRSSCCRGRSACRHGSGQLRSTNPA